MGKERKRVELPDGRVVIVRQAELEADLDSLTSFFSRLPPDLRNHLRFNVTERSTMAWRLAQVDNRDHWRLIAELDGVIIGDATMDREPYGWTRHVAQLRGVIEPADESLGIGPLLFRELVAMGAEAGIELLCSEVMEGDEDLLHMLEQEGFTVEVRRKKYVKDMHGKPHDLIILSNNLEAAWKRLDELITEMDIRTIQSAY